MATKKVSKKTVRTGGNLPPEILVMAPAPVEKRWFGVKPQTVVVVVGALLIVAVLIFAPF